MGMAQPQLMVMLWSVTSVLQFSLQKGLCYLVGEKKPERLLLESLWMLLL